jgi:hypothetical protein
MMKILKIRHPAGASWVGRLDIREDQQQLDYLDKLLHNDYQI